MKIGAQLFTHLELDVEVDVPVGDPMDNCRRSYNFLVSLQKPAAA